MNIKRLMKIKDADRNAFKRGVKVNATLPNNRSVSGTYVEPYAPDKHTIKGDDGKLYGVPTSNIERVGGRTRNGNASKIRQYQSEIKSLRDELRTVNADMEEMIAQAAMTAAEQNGTDYNDELDSIVNDGNNPIVVEYGDEIDRINNEIQKLQNKIRQYKNI